MTKQFAFLLGSTLLSIPFFTLLISTFFFTFGGVLNGFIFPFAILLSFLTSFVFAKKAFPEAIKMRTMILGLSICVSIIIASLFLCSLFYDYSFDGQCYHQDILFSLSNGWNPFYQVHSPNLNQPAYMALFVDHYTKGLETIWAAVYCTTGNVESAKGINLLFVLSSFFLFYAMLRDIFNQLSTSKQILLAFSFTFCPVVLMQWFTFYIDFSMYSLLLSLVSLFCMLSGKNDIFKYFLIGVIISLAASIKFNILFWIGIATMFYMTSLLVMKRFKRFRSMFITVGTSLLFGCFFFGFNPFVINTIQHHSPIYPLEKSTAPDEYVDLFTSIEPYRIGQASRPMKVFYSLFSYPQNDMDTETVLAIPLTFRNTTDLLLRSSDQRIGAFGIFFSGILIFSFIIYLFTQIKCKKYRFYFGSILITLFISLFILPGGWLGRYVPFCWGIPLTMLLYSELDSGISSWLIGLRRLTYGLLILNIGLAFVSFSTKSLFNRARVDTITTELRNANSPVELSFGFCNASFKEKLKGIEYKEITRPIPDVNDSLSTWKHLYFMKKPNVGVYYNSKNIILNDSKKSFIIVLKEKYVKSKD